MCAEHRHILYQLLCTGGVDPENPHHPLDNPEHLGMVLCRDWLGWFLSFPVSKVAVILAFAVYLVGAGMGCARVKQGVELYHLFSYNSYAARASYLETQYQYQYMFRIQLVVNEPLEYHKQSVRDEISNMMKRLTQLEFIADSELTESWLNYYTNVFQTEPRSSWLVRGFNITRKKDFYNCLRFAFLRFPPAQRFLSDINFNDNYTQIVSSRFYVNTEGLKTIHDIQNTMMEIRKIVDSMPFKVIAFNSYFPLLDLNTIIFDIAFMAMLASSGIVMLITVIFISSFVSCLFIALAIASIEVGLIGYLAWWDVSLNPITIVGLIMCIGLSVDNVAHISHAYVSSSIRDPNKRMAQALYRVGVPILQSAGSTVAGTVLFALFPPSYTYLVLFKTICLIMIFSSAHSLLLVPVLLTIFDRSKPRTPENQPKLLVTDDRCGPPQKGTPECQPMILVSSSEDCLK
ncbi:daf-6 [Cordylochernes scorpioides]|uniref:Daf-6 n=1 Tax=Cordylochernes scorpioides TaxID=51811 RepID=A0ABY6JW69_9ARAC|nr:daf-6 [Cordylochernes scorpioides]